jgi:hypothetical protein
MTISSQGECLGMSLSTNQTEELFLVNESQSNFTGPIRDVWFIILVWTSSWCYGNLRTWRDLLRIANDKHLTLRKLAWDFKAKDKQLRFITPIMRSVVITCPSRILLLIHCNCIPKMKSWFLTPTLKSTELKMRILLEYIMFLSIFTLPHGKCHVNFLKSHSKGWINFY